MTIPTALKIAKDFKGFIGLVIVETNPAIVVMPASKTGGLALLSVCIISSWWRLTLVIRGSFSNFW